MNPADAYELLTAVAADLDWIADRYRDHPDTTDPVALLRTITTQTDDFSQQIGHILTTIAAALDQLG